MGLIGRSRRVKSSGNRADQPLPDPGPPRWLSRVAREAIVGLVFGTIFAVTGRLWMLMCAHAAFDLAALAMIYLGTRKRRGSPRVQLAAKFGRRGPEKMDSAAV